MREHLKTNILNFKWPNSAPTFYFALQDTEGCHPIHKSKISRQIKEAFPNTDFSTIEEIYTSFTLPLEKAKKIKISLVDGKELRIYKQYLTLQLKKHFKAQGHIVVKNFVRDTQIWLPSTKQLSEHYKLYYKFSFKIQFAKLTDQPELIISYDGSSKVLNTPVKDIEETEHIKRCVYQQKTFNYQMKLDTEDKQDFHNNIDFSQVFPIYNLQLAKELNIPIEEPTRPANKYQKYVALINKFAEKYLFTKE